MRLGELWWQFIKIGVAAFGGLGVTLSLIHRYMVTDRRVLTEQDVAESLTYTKLLPGSTGVQVVGYLCYRLRGWRGAAVGTVAFLFPAFILMLLLSVLYEEINAGLGDAATPALRGLTASVVGILVATIYRLARPIVTTVAGGTMAIAACAAGIALEPNPAWIVMTAGVIGILTPNWFGEDAKQDRQRERKIVRP
jgi:chromate transporter